MTDIDSIVFYTRQIGVEQSIPICFSRNSMFSFSRNMI